jgi:hypothetical protein
LKCQSSAKGTAENYLHRNAGLRVDVVLCIRPERSFLDVPA